jgi:TetR/AcrR family transcriptional repressor of nem operon
MSRPIEFDRDRAVQQAVMLFWQKGYQAASLAELLKAMGLSRSSFYAAFGDKHGLFIECLDVFAFRTQAILRRARDRKPPMTALRNYFERSFGKFSEPDMHFGCMLVNTVIELAAIDQDLRDIADRHLKTVQDLFEACLRDAGAEPDEARQAAAFLMMVNDGARVGNRQRVSISDQLARINTAFRYVEMSMDERTQLRS